MSAKDNIIYGGKAPQVKKQQLCEHEWDGPYLDDASRYYKCQKCFCIMREKDCENTKKDDLHAICGAYVYSVQLDYDYHYDYHNGKGVVTLHFRKPRTSANCLDRGYKEPLETEISFPFKQLTVKRKDR